MIILSRKRTKFTCKA